MIRHIQIPCNTITKDGAAYYGPSPTDWFYWCGSWKHVDGTKMFWLPFEEHTYESATHLYNQWLGEIGNDNLVIVFADIGKIGISESEWIGFIFVGAIRAASSLDSLDPNRNDPWPLAGGDDEYHNSRQ